MTTLNATRVAELHSQIAAQRANDFMASNPLAADGLADAFSQGKAYAAATMTWAEIEAMATRTDASLSALVGTEVAPSVTYSTLADVREFRKGVLQVFNALLHVAKGTNTRGHSV